MQRKSTLHDNKCQYLMKMNFKFIKYCHTDQEKTHPKTPPARVNALPPHSLLFLFARSSTFLCGLRPKALRPDRAPPERLFSRGIHGAESFSRVFQTVKKAQNAKRLLDFAAALLKTRLALNHARSARRPAIKARCTLFQKFYQYFYIVMEHEKAFWGK